MYVCVCGPHIAVYVVHESSAVNPTCHVIVEQVNAVH